MHIVFAASECKPWARTGGLAEVVGSLPAALAATGHRVTTFVPYYRSLARGMPDARVVLASVTVPFSQYQRFARVLDGGVHAGVQIYFVDCPEMFDREAFYGTPSGDYADNWERFALFCRVVLEASKILAVPDVFHAHDWETSLLPVYLRSLYYFDPVLRRVPCVLTIHNAEYQGQFPAEIVPRLMLPWEMYTPQGIEAYGSVNFLKAGIVYADALTTVSQRYAEEIQTPEYGASLDGILRTRAGDLSGIRNGVDYDEWDPERDSRIAAHFCADNLAGKRECRRDLLHAFGLDSVGEATAVLGIVSRFAVQKGLGLIAEIVDELMREDVVLIVCGSGEEYFERLFQELAEKYPGRICVQTTFEETTAHKIQAGSDMLLMPSLYEPGGLSQLHALCYGTVPVVRATGGLDDTVTEQPVEQRNGYKFEGKEASALLATVRRALADFQNKEQWEAVVQRGMRQNYSWQQPAEQYLTVYRAAIERRLGLFPIVTA